MTLRRYDDIHEDDHDLDDDAAPPALTAPKPETIRLAEAFIQLTGGTMPWEFAHMHYGKGESIRAIKELFGDDAPDVSTIHRQVQRCWREAERFGLLPPGWKKHKPGGRRTVKTHGTDAVLYDGKLGQRRNGKNFL